LIAVSKLLLLLQPGLQAHEKGAAEEEIAENTQDYNGKGVLLQPY
jgi:hypothetical protein